MTGMDEMSECGRIAPPAKWSAMRRIVSIVGAVVALIEDNKPTHVVIEIPSGKPGTGSRLGAKSALIVYGLAAGMISMAVMDELGYDCVTLMTEQWIRSLSKEARTSRNKKAARRTMCSLLFSQYDMEQDKGGDACDAILLGRRWFELQATGTLVSAPETAFPFAEG